MIYGTRSNAPDPPLSRLSHSSAVPLRTVQIEHSVARRQRGVPIRARWPAGRFTARADERMSLEDLTIKETY